MFKQLFLFLFPIICFSQNYNIMYELNFKPNKNSNMMKKEMMALDINMDSKKSNFYSYAKEHSDSIFVEYNKGYINESSLLSINTDFTFNIIISKDYTSNETQTIEYLQGVYYRYTEKENFSWNIGTDKKLILGVECIKATTNFGGRYWTAWYSSQIPINDGPYKFRNLPGIILQITSDDNEYNFLATSIKKNNKKINNKLPKVILDISKEKLHKIKLAYIDNPSAKSRQDDIADGFSGAAVINGKKYSAEEAYRFLDEELWSWLKDHNNYIEKNYIWLR